MERTSAGSAGRIRLLVLDVDGTVTTSRHEISPATAAAIRRVHDAGIGVVLATGRRYRDTLPVARRLAVETPLVTASGALVKRPSDHVTLARASFGVGVLEGVLRQVVAAGHEPVVYTDSFALGYDFHCRGLQAGSPAPAASGLAEYLEKNRGLAHVVPDLDRAVPAGAFAGFTMGDRSAMTALEESLHAAFPGGLALHTIRSPRYREWMCEIAPAGVTKWSGVLRLAEAWGIAPEEICAVGDDVNDLPMLRAAGLGIAMGNARPEVLAAVNRVVASSDDDGLVEVAEIVIGSG
jgi:hydroxymethylpyrimidine pyrophosphatase-like HAD family hydrolase